MNAITKISAPLRISELAAAVGVDSETIRYYEKTGLLPPPARSDNGYRAYGQAHVQRLAFIRHCRSLDMGLPDVRRLRQFQNNPELACDDINELIDSQITRIHQQIESLRLLEQQLHTLRDSCHHHDKIRDCGILKNLEQAAKGENCDCHAEAGLKKEPVMHQPNAGT